MNRPAHQVIFIDVNHLSAHMDLARYYLSTLSPLRRLAFDLVMTGLADDQKVTYDLESGRDGRESAINIALA